MASSLTRNKENELIMISIYDALIYISMNEEFSLQDVMEAVYGGLVYEDIPFFSREIVIRSLSHINEITEAFQKNMPKWKFDRLNTLERALLLMSYTNYKIVGDIEKNVVINTAVKLAKKYLDKDDYKFVNAILDNVL